jgi:hypothetical protein
MRKLLVVGIIVLFIGVAVVPSITSGITVKCDSIKDIKETVDNSVIVLSDSKDYCNCSDKLNNNDKSVKPICVFLERLIAFYHKINDHFEKRARPYYFSRPYLYKIYMLLSERMDRKAREIIDTGASIDCWDYPYP